MCERKPLCTIDALRVGNDVFRQACKSDNGIEYIAIHGRVPRWSCGLKRVEGSNPLPYLIKPRDYR